MASSLPPEHARLDDLLACARKRFDVTFKPVRIGEHTLQITHIENMKEYLDKLANEARQGEGIELPMWAKIWPASTILALTMLQIPPVKGKRILEVGAGLGIPALVAAARGFSTTISDINEDALLFTRINILKNGLEDRASILSLNILTEDTDTPYDVILGSEMFAIRGKDEQLLRFLRNSLAPQGMALLARDASRRRTGFLAKAADYYDIGIKQVGYTPPSEGEKPFQADLYRLVAKKRDAAQ